MDSTEGGTMTPPHDEDATCDDFAPVIPLRRRQPDPEPDQQTENIDPDSPGIWDLDAPLADLTARPSRSAQPSATDALTRPPIGTVEPSPSSDREATIAARGRPRLPHFPRRRVALIALACCVLAAPAGAVLAGGGGSHPHATHAATAGPTSALGRTVTPTAPAKTEPKSHTHHPAAGTAKRSRAVARHSAKRRVRHPALARSEHTSQSATATSSSPPAPPPQARTTPIQQIHAPAHSSGTVNSRGASA